MNLGAVNAEQSESRWKALGAPLLTHFHSQVYAQSPITLPPRKEARFRVLFLSRKSEGGWFL